MRSLLLRLRSLVLWFARLIGSDIVDQRTGRSLGRALLVSFRGKVYLIGLNAVVAPTFAPQDRLTYWKQEIGFTTHPEPDFPNEARP